MIKFFTFYHFSFSTSSGRLTLPVAGLFARRAATTLELPRLAVKFKFSTQSAAESATRSTSMTHTLTNNGTTWSAPRERWKWKPDRRSGAGLYEIFVTFLLSFTTKCLQSVKRKPVKLNQLLSDNGYFSQFQKKLNLNLVVSLFYSDQHFIFR